MGSGLSLGSLMRRVSMRLCRFSGGAMSLSQDYLLINKRLTRRSTTRKEYQIQTS